MGAELHVEDKQGGLKQGDSTTRTIGTETEGAGGVTHLVLDIVLENSVVDGRVVGAEVRYAQAGALLVLAGALRRHTSSCCLPDPVVSLLVLYCPFRPQRWAMTMPAK